MSARAATDIRFFSIIGFGFVRLITVGRPQFSIIFYLLFVSLALEANKRKLKIIETMEMHALTDVNVLCAIHSARQSNGELQNAF